MNEREKLRMTLSHDVRKPGDKADRSLVLETGRPEFKCDFIH